MEELEALADVYRRSSKIELRFQLRRDATIRDIEFIGGSHGVTSWISWPTKTGSSATNMGHDDLLAALRRVQTECAGLHFVPGSVWTRTSGCSIHWRALRQLARESMQRAFP